MINDHETNHDNYYEVLELYHEKRKKNYQLKNSFQNDSNG